MVTEAMRISQRCVDLVKSFEGFYDYAYLCPANVWTIGYGTTVYPDGRPVRQGDRCTQEQAEHWLAFDLAKFADDVERLVKVPITQTQFDALVSFHYNTGALGKSTLLVRLNELHYDAAAREFLKWTKAKGKVLGGLVKRRAAEMQLFQEE